MTKVLFVDDEISILNSIRRAVMDEKFDSEFALSGQEALEILDKEPVGVIVTDMRMPVMDGLALLRRVKEKYPHIVRIVLSGYTQLPQVIATINQGEIFQFITKPWKMEEDLLSVVRRALDFHEVQCKETYQKKSMEQKVLGYQNIFREMEHRIANTKNDFYTAKKINATIFDLFRKQCCTGSLSQPRLSRRIDMLEVTVQSYLDMLPLQQIKLARTKLMGMIVEKLGRIFVVQDNSDTNKQEHLTCSGSTQLLYWIVETLSELLELEQRTVRCQIYTKSGEQNDFALCVMLHVSLMENDDYLSDTEYVVEIIDRMMQDHAVQLLCTKTRDAVNIALSTTFQIVS